jgi:hypothetical protein
MTISTRTQLDELLAYLPTLETARRSFGEARELEQLSENTISAPWVSYQPDIVHFFALASQPCFIDYNYLDKSPQAWLEDSDFLATATLEQTITLLTFCNRAERFNEGAWKSVLEKGIIQNILRRMQVLRDEIGPV